MQGYCDMAISWVLECVGYVGLCLFVGECVSYVSLLVIAWPCWHGLLVYSTIDLPEDCRAERACVELGSVTDIAINNNMDPVL